MTGLPAAGPALGTLAANPPRPRCWRTNRYQPIQTPAGLCTECRDQLINEQKVAS